MKSLRVLCGAVLAALLFGLASCGGNNQSTPVLATPVPDTFVTAVQTIATNSPDDTEPVAIDVIVATAPEDTEPLSI